MVDFSFEIIVEKRSLKLSLITLLSGKSEGMRQNGHPLNFNQTCIILPPKCILVWRCKGGWNLKLSNCTYLMY